jgi:hypothetical protein
MSALSPLVTDWIANKLKWKYIYSPKRVPRALAPNEMYKIGEHKHPEGTLIMAAAAFDNPKCGLRMKAAPELDTERGHTILYLMAAGGAEPVLFTTIAVPPRTPPGIFELAILKEWPWNNFVEIYVYNDDPDESHTCLWCSYTVMVLTEERLTPSPEVEAQILAAQQEITKSLKGGG